MILENFSQAALIKRCRPFLRFKGRVAAVVQQGASLFNYAPVCRRVNCVFCRLYMTFPHKPWILR